MKKKFFSAAFVLICLCLLAALPVNAATSKSRSDAVSWVASKEGTTVGSGQCVALISAYYEYLGFYGVSGDACDYSWNEIPDGLGWREQGGVPNPGDILVYTGGYGHVAICGDSTSVSWHQNWGGQYVQWVSRNYNESFYSSYEGVTKYYWGCIHVNFNDDTNPPTIKNFRTTNVTAQSITVSMDLNDNVGVTSVKFNIWGPNGHKGYSVSASNGTFSHTIKTSDYGGEGSYSIHVNVYDAAGNDTFAKLSGIPTPANFGDSFFGIISHHASGKPIEVGEDKYVVIGTKNGKANQVWKFQRESDGCYTIASNKTKNLLEMSGGNRENGTQASAGVEDWGGYYQRWYIYPQGDGYVILSKHYTDDRRVLDVDGGGSADGTKILTYERLNNSNQIFDITRLTVPTLSVLAGTSAKSTVFKWNDFYGSESYYDLKLWNGTYWVGDAYRLEWNIKSPCAMHLPAGHYEGYVDFTIGKLGAMSNVVKFDVAEDSSDINIFSRRTVTDTGYDIHADIKYLTQSALYAAAMYTSDGKLLDVQTTPVASGAASADVAFTKQEGAAYFKVFLWDNLKSMQPLTESERINV